MSRFPRTEPEITALALKVSEGLGKAAEDFPTPPVSAAELKAKLDVFNGADTATGAAKTAYLEQHAAKDEALEDLVDVVKANLRYAEIAVREPPEKLSQLGWGTNPSRRSRAPAAPDGSPHRHLGVSRSRPRLRIPGFGGFRAARVLAGVLGPAGSRPRERLGAAKRPRDPTANGWTPPQAPWTVHSHRPSRPRQLPRP